MIWFLGANVMSPFVSQIQTDVNSKRNGLFLCKRGKNFYEKRAASSFLFATATSKPQHYIVFVSAHTPHGMLQTSCARVYVLLLFSPHYNFVSGFLYLFALQGNWNWKTQLVYG